VNDSSGKPKLSFTVHAGAYSPALKSVSITLPGGFTLARRRALLDKGITVKGARFSVRTHRSTLTITFRSPVTSASVALRGPAITVSAAESRKARRRALRNVRFMLTTTDAANTGVTFRVTVKKLL
jgi:hypothetical protein